jgi:hypothetical protein
MVAVVQHLGRFYIITFKSPNFRIFCITHCVLLCIQPYLRQANLNFNFEN